MEKHQPKHDNQDKTTEFRPFSPAVTPEMRTFHLSWFNLFSCFFTTFSIPPLLPIIRQDLNLTPTDIGTAGSASFVGSIVSRLLMGPICDLVGPRKASGILSLITAPIILFTSFVSSPIQFILVRFLLGFSLANFVANQFWMTSMFSDSVVGSANAFAAGWANTGAGVTQLLMPLIYSFLLNFIHVSSSSAWRLSFIFPAIFQAITGVLVLAFGHDSKYKNMNIKKNVVQNQNQTENNSNSNSNALKVVFGGLKDYRGWILGLLYGFSFGVEMTTDNIIAQYFYDRFGVNLQSAGTIAACFGMANLFSRPMGGYISDEMGKKFGVRGRLVGLWVVQTVAGLLCVLLGRVESLVSSVVVMCCFSVFVQAASGLTFGVVPFVSQRSLGVISGMTGSGGTIGAVVTQLLLFSGDNLSKETSISLMGLMMILCTLPVTLIYFPQWGGIFCGPSKDHDYENDYSLLE